MHRGSREEKVDESVPEASYEMDKLVNKVPEAQHSASITPEIRKVAQDPLGFDDFHGAVAVDRLDLENTTAIINSFPSKEDIEDLCRQMSILQRENHDLRMAAATFVREEKHRSPRKSVDYRGNPCRI